MISIDEAGIPDTEICRAAHTYARTLYDPVLYNHVMRSYLFGAMAGKAASTRVDRELLFVGALLHDLGLVEDCMGPDRFEIDGADAAALFLREKGYPEDRIEIIWDAIALHTTYAIPQRKRPEIALVQLGAGIDIGVAPLELVNERDVDEILEAYPRLDFKTVMISKLAGIASRKPETTTHNFTCDVAERHVHGFQRVNFCDAVHAAPFAE